MTPNSTEELVALKPCVRCGRTPTITERDVEPQHDPWYGQKIEKFVLCECGMCLFDEYFHDGFVSDEDAIAAWNTRTDNDVSGLELRLRMIVSHASGGALHERESLDWSINDICVEISRHKNHIWEQAQKSALAKHRLSNGGK